MKIFKAKTFLAAVAMIGGSAPAIAQNVSADRPSCNKAHKATLEVTIFNNLIGNEMDRAYRQQMLKHPTMNGVQLRRLVLKQVNSIENVRFLRQEVRRRDRELLNAPSAEDCLKL